VRRFPVSRTGLFLTARSTPTVAAMHDALVHQLRISKSHLLKTFCDELYAANFRSIRCVKSSDLFSGEVAVTSGSLRLPCESCSGCGNSLDRYGGGAGEGSRESVDWIASDDCEKRLPVQAERKKLEQPAHRVETRWPMRPRKVYSICDGPKKRTHSPERRVA
jgi:hypothetical protein